MISRHLLLAVGAAFLGAQLFAADQPIDEIRNLLNTGDYLRAAGLTDKATRENPDDEDMHVMRIRALMELGRYPEADSAAINALKLVPQSIRLRWEAHNAALAVGKDDIARRDVAEIRTLVTQRPGSYRDPLNLVVFAEMALDIGADAKQVLDQVLATALKSDPKVREIYLVKGGLALSKHDYDLAAKTFQEGLKIFPDEADFHYGLARAYETGDRATLLKELQAALKINPKHVPSLLLVADHRIDAEDYDGATKTLDEVRAVNPWRPESWAYTAVLAHLNSEPATEKIARDNALRYWAKNPQVDWLIGKKLGEKYRFLEGSEYQRKSLEFDPDYQPAKEELATDLLRLGQEKEGWDLAQEVFNKDQYDVEAFNLMNLRDTMAKYATLKNDDFVLRMTQQEADIYGERTLAMLTEAKKLLTAKYGIEIAKPTYVEVFGDQKDFAVRTFGMPDIPGFLGVCFGRVVTANGAAANAAHPTNWESVLWHEFTHVITLQKTQNKMPRWLSEGISVYEESQRDPTWGMPLSARYRDFIEKDDMTPVSGLSGAFLAPPSPEKLQFAYFESAMVVEFIIQKFGLEPLKQILVDLGNGEEINKALAAHTVSIETLDKQFAEYARARAEALAPKLEWDRPDDKLFARGQEQALAAWATSHPENYFALVMHAQKALADKDWATAKTILAHIVDLYPNQNGPENAYRMLAAANRGLNDTGAERAALVRLTETSDDSIDAYTRLMELGQQAGDWDAVSKYADKYLAVNPLVIAPYRYLARAAAARNDTTTAIAANRTMLKLDPPDPTEVHYQLAKLLHSTGNPEAERHVVMALEYAPRYQDALKLLREISDAKPAPAPANDQAK